MATLPTRVETPSGPTAPHTVDPGVITLLGVPYRVYGRLVREPGNHGLRMTYHDGMLEIMSPRWIHERFARRLGLLVLALTSELGIPCEGAGSTTFRRSQGATFRGRGKEPDQGFYLANLTRIEGKDEINLDAGDPPPDLWIEVDNRGGSRGKLPVYAALGVPEVWRARARTRTIRFLRLVDGKYQAIDRSLGLPMLTPALVLEAMNLGTDLTESAWDVRLRAWVRERLAPLTP